MTLLERRERAVRSAIRQCATTFHNHRDELQDLSPRFWIAMRELECAADEDRGPYPLSCALRAAYKQLGAPGDFGYGTPCGDALKALYDTWNDWTAEKKQAIVGANGARTPAA